MEEKEYRKKDVNYKRFAFLVTVVLAVVAWINHEDIREKEFQKAYYVERINAINNVFEIVRKIDMAQSKNEKLKASKEFWLVHHGYSIVYFTPEMHSALEPISDYINKCIQEFYSDSSINCKFSILMYLSGFSSTAREVLAKGWDIDFEEIAVSHPWHPEPN